MRHWHGHYNRVNRTQLHSDNNLWVHTSLSMYLCTRVVSNNNNNNNNNTVP